MLSRSGNLAPETVQEYSQMFFSKPNYHFQFSIVRRRAFTWMDGWIRGLARYQPRFRSCLRDCARNLVRLRWWKTQPPKSPLSGGTFHSIPPLSEDFPLNSPLIRGTFHSIPPLSGDFPLNSPLIRGTFHSIPPLSGGLSTQFPPDKGDFPLNSPLIRGARGVKNDERWVSCTVSYAGMTNIDFYTVATGSIHTIIKQQTNQPINGNYSYER